MAMRTNSIALVVGCIALLTVAQTTLATPGNGANCAQCHVSPLGTITISGNDSTANPTEACGTPDLGTLPIFQVAQGGTKTLSGQVSGLPSGASYAAVLKKFEQAGVEHCAALAYTPDSTWLQRTTPAPTYYTLPLTGNWYTAPSGATSFPFSIIVDAAAPADFYELVLAVGGRSDSMFYTEAHFYVQVTAVPTNPTISLDKTSLSPAAAQGSSPANDTFAVSNTGAGTLNYTVSADQTWLSFSPASGSTAGPAQTITVQYNTASLAAGTYPATITVSDPNATNNPQTISVTLIINIPNAPPNIVLNKTALSPAAAQGAGPPNDTFTISNTGGGMLNYSVSADQTWLTASPSSGSTTGPAQTVTVQYSAASLAAGTYPATITVSDPNATNNPQTIAVTLTINPPPPPTISVSTASLTPAAKQGSNSHNDTFTVSNTGSGTLNYSVSADASWLTVSPASGSTPGPAVTATVQYDTASLSAGAFNATITISDPSATNNPRTIGVTLTINPPPIAQPTITLDKTSLAPFAVQGANPLGDEIIVGNSGMGVLNYSVTSDAGWLLPSRLNGSTTGRRDTVGVAYLTTSMPAGTYAATITVSDRNATNNPQTIGVVLTISAHDAPSPSCGLGFPLLGLATLCGLVAMKTGRGRSRQRPWIFR